MANITNFILSKWAFVWAWTWMSITFQEVELLMRMARKQVKQFNIAERPNLKAPFLQDVRMLRMSRDGSQNLCSWWSVHWAFTPVGKYHFTTLVQHKITSHLRETARERKRERGFNPFSRVLDYRETNVYSLTKYYAIFGICFYGFVTFHK